MSEREAFEAWWKTVPIHRPLAHLDAWAAWQARAAVQANVPDAEAVKDAERYRWLRAALADRSVNGRSHWFCSIPENQPEWLDTEIDVAMLSAIQKG